MTTGDRPLPPDSGGPRDIGVLGVYCVIGMERPGDWIEARCDSIWGRGVIAVDSRGRSGLAWLGLHRRQRKDYLDSLPVAQDYMHREVRTVTRSVESPMQRTSPRRLDTTWTAWTGLLACRADAIKGALEYIDEKYGGDAGVRQRSGNRRKRHRPSSLNPGGKRLSQPSSQRQAAPARYASYRRRRSGRLGGRATAKNSDPKPVIAAMTMNGTR